MTFEQTLTLSKKQLERVQELCGGPPGRDEVRRSEVALEWEIPFPHRMMVSLQVVAPNDPDEESCWCQAVLFRIEDPSGFVYGEVACSDVEEGLLGEWVLEHDGRKFVVNVKEGD